ncbi:MAG: V-type ATP synthase subunit E [Candidatus Wukongarchaeota archaeon]|nr:V-type ATP synthase subunit E family protein [Candidatus Wukongarchaeota archaeon]
MDVLEKMREGILSDAKAEAEEFIEKAKAEVEEILSKAEEKAQKEAQEILARGERELEAEKRRSLGKIRLAEKMRKLKAMEEHIDKAFEETLESLRELARTSDYKEILANFIVEGGIGLGGGELKVMARKEDIKDINAGQLAEVIAKETGNETTVSLSEANVNCAGGVIVQLKDGSIIIDNTFEARLERDRRDLRVKIAKILFEEA